VTEFVWVGLAAFIVAGGVAAVLGGSWRRVAALASVLFFVAALALVFVLPSVPPYGCTDEHSVLAALQVACALGCATAAGFAAGAAVRARAIVHVMLEVVLGAAALVLVWAPYVCSLVT
jgi:hypothetical protein